MRSSRWHRYPVVLALVAFEWEEEGEMVAVVVMVLSVLGSRSICFVSESFRESTRPAEHFAAIVVVHLPSCSTIRHNLFSTVVDRVNIRQNDCLYAS